MCQEVYDCLVGIRTDLRRMVFSSVKWSENLSRLITHMCSQLDMFPLSVGCDCKQLFSTLCAHDSGNEALEKLTEMIAPQSEWFQLEARFRMEGWSSWSVNILFTVLQDQIKLKVNYSDLVSIPETIILPIIDNIHTLVPYEYRKMFKQLLYRYIGDCFHALSVHLGGGNRSVSNVCLEKAVQYYFKGREMVHPDGWSDNGLGGDVLLAKLNSLSDQERQWGSLKIMCTLQDGKWKATDTIGQSMVSINLTTGLSLCPWKFDKEIHSLMLRSVKNITLTFHPLALGYYIMARCYLRQEDRGRFKLTVDKLRKCLNKMSDDEQKESTRSLINILARV